MSALVPLQFCAQANTLAPHPDPNPGLRSWLRLPGLQARWLCFIADVLSRVLYVGKGEPTGFTAYL